MSDQKTTKKSERIWMRTRMNGAKKKKTMILKKTTTVSKTKKKNPKKTKVLMTTSFLKTTMTMRLKPMPTKEQRCYETHTMNSKKTLTNSLSTRWRATQVEKADVEQELQE